MATERKFTHKSQFLDNTEYIIAYGGVPVQQSVLVHKDGTTTLCGREWSLQACLRNVAEGRWIEIT